MDTRSNCSIASRLLVSFITHGAIGRLAETVRGRERGREREEREGVKEGEAERSRLRLRPGQRVGGRGSERWGD